MLKQGINRNILECKVRCFNISIRTTQSINRNILECKVRSGRYLNDGFAVLIETYWNVKKDDLVFLKNSFSY